MNIVGVGGTLMGDDGLGVTALQRLAERPERIGPAALHDAGLAVSDVLGRLDPDVPLIVIDAIHAGRRPGSVYKMKLDGLGAADASMASCISLHELSAVRALDIEAMIGRRFKDVTIFGVEPASLACGEGLSPVVAAAMGKLVDAVMEHVDQTCAAAAGDTAT